MQSERIHSGRARGRKGRGALAALTLAAGMLFAANSSAEITDGVIRIGSLSDVTGPYSPASGQGAQIAIELAIEEFGGRIGRRPIEVVLADSKNTPDTAAAIARRWIEEEGVDMITDMPSSAVAITVQNVARELDEGTIVIQSGGGSSTLTGVHCREHSIHWQWNTELFAGGVATTIAQENPGSTWFVITLDHAFGRGIYAGVEEAIAPFGGEIIGAHFHPFAEDDYFDMLQDAVDSGADVIALGNAGQSLIEGLRQAKEVGVGDGDQRLVSIMTLLMDIRALGLYTAQGMQFVAPYYWDQSEGSRDFARRFRQRFGSNPSSAQITAYVATLHYLKAVEKSGHDRGDAVMKAMREIPIDDGITRNGYIRADGRMVHDTNFVEVKSPSQSQGLEDYLNILAVIPGEEGFPPPSGDCPYLQ